MNYSKRNNNVCTCCNRVTARLKHNYIAGPMKYQRVKGGRCSLLTLLAIMSTKLRIIPVIMAHTWYVTVSSTSQRIPFPRERTPFNSISARRHCNHFKYVYISWIIINITLCAICEKLSSKWSRLRLGYPFVVESEYGGMQWTIS